MTYSERMTQKAKSLASKVNIHILAVETSCDETSASVIKDGRHVMSNIIASQIELHKQYGGVVPEIASRKHVETINQVIDHALQEASVGLSNIDAIAVTYGPGLVGALLIGLSTAKALAFGLSVPLLGIHHIEGHICANYIEHKDLEPPFLCLVVSGGHTQLVHVMDYGSYKIIGQTRDDAAGEAYDKISRTLGLGYPGGPAIDNLAKHGNPKAIQFPRVQLKDHPHDFSFSGLKTAVINYIHQKTQNKEAICPQDIAASFQQAVVDVLSQKALRCAEELKLEKIVLAGGVAANSLLRSQMGIQTAARNMRLYYPSPLLCTDNAAMIGCAGYYQLQRQKISDLSLNATPYLPISE